MAAKPDPVLVELTRGALVESVHRGALAVCDARGRVKLSLGDIARPVFPRSSYKMMQALPLVESGAADAFSVTPKELALACASHSGEAFHVATAGGWLKRMGLKADALACGPHLPFHEKTAHAMIRAGKKPTRLHNNCSGKHSGFLTVVKHLKAGPEYVEIDHPLQVAIKTAFEEVTGEAAAGWGIDGCSAPNFATSVAGLARSMATFAAASEGGDSRQRAMHRLTRAMATHPELVAGEGRSCTELMRAMGGRVAIKTGAEAVFVAIVPEKGLGIALKIEDGNSRASEAAIVALLTQIGVLDGAHPMAQKRLPAEQRNWRGLRTGELRLSEGFL